MSWNSNDKHCWKDSKSWSSGQGEDDAWRDAWRDDAWRDDGEVKQEREDNKTPKSSEAKAGKSIEPKQKRQKSLPKSQKQKDAAKTVPAPMSPGPPPGPPPQTLLDGAKPGGSKQRREDPASANSVPAGQLPPPGPPKEQPPRVTGNSKPELSQIYYERLVHSEEKLVRQATVITQVIGEKNKVEANQQQEIDQLWHQHEFEMEALKEHLTEEQDEFCEKEEFEFQSRLEEEENAMHENAEQWARVQAEQLAKDQFKKMMAAQQRKAKKEGISKSEIRTVKTEPIERPALLIGVKDCCSEMWLH